MRKGVLRAYANSKHPCPEVIKLFFMLNSAENEIRPANKFPIINNIKFSLAKHS